MTPEDLASLHASAMTVPAPWSVDDFRALLEQKGTFLIPSPAPEYPGESARRATPLSHGATPEAAQPLAGFALGRVTIDEAELLTLATHPDHRRRSVGRACLSGFEAEAAKRGAATLHLEVAETNAPAIALYRSAGWTETGRRKAYYKGAEARIDAILMTKQFDTG